MTDEKWYLVDRWLGICSSDLWPRSIEILLHLLSWSWNNKINLTVGGWREQFQQKISWWTLLPQYDIEGQGPPPLITGPPPPRPPSLHRHQLHIYLCSLHTPQSPHGTWRQHRSCWGGRLRYEKSWLLFGKSNVSRHISIPWMAADNKAHRFIVIFCDWPWILYFYII